MNKKILPCLFGVAALLSWSASQAEEQPQDYDYPPKPSFIDLQRDYLSEQFLNLASAIDGFFGTERNFQETSNSVLQIDATQVMGRNGSPKVALTYKAKLHLPNAQKRFHLLLESSPDRNLPGTSTTTQAKQLQQTSMFKEVTGPDSYGAAIRFENPEDSPWRLSADGGLKADTGANLIDISIHPFARSSVSYVQQLGIVQMKVTQSIYDFNTTGPGENSQLEFSHEVSEKTLLRTTSSATFLYDKQHFDFYQDFSVFHTVNEKASLLYQLSASGIGRPSAEVSEYVAQVLYRRKIHRDWVFLEINPQLHYPKATNFLLDAQLIARLEFMFSK